MPHHREVSAKEIMARVIRNAGYKIPSVYHDDMLEWIPEAIGMLGATKYLETKSTGKIDQPGAINISNHFAPLPCGLITILAVEDKDGRLLPEGGDITDVTNATSQRHKGIADTDFEIRPTLFEVNPLDHQTQDGTPTTKPGSTVPIYGEDIKKVDSFESKHYYKLSGNSIQASFESGFLRIHYLALPVCEEGYPLIPDNENFKSAVAWYVLMMLIGAGYEHRVFTWERARQEWETYAARAMAEISYPSLDTAARVNRSIIRLIPPYHFYEDFFVNSEQTQRMYK